jgi:hypothetical protein
MYLTALIFILSILLTSMFMRGGVLHNHLARQAGVIFHQAGFQVWYEYPVRLHNGHLDFVDLIIQQGDCQICIEIETTARHVIDNVIKAKQAYLPLWIVVPNLKVQHAVTAKLADTELRPGGLRIYILLLGQLKQTLTNCFPLIIAADHTLENK